MKLTPPGIGRARLGLVVLLSLTLGLVGCSSGGQSGGGSSASGGSTLTISEADAPYTVNGNPLSAGSSMISGDTGLAGFIYEPLLQFNYLKPSQVTPWLATSYQWSDNGKTLTFQIRHGVRWSDGKPFTAADVAFTFNLLHKFPALNLDGIDFTSATATGQYTFQITQPTSNYQNLFYIASQVIVPEHIWATISNPVNFTDTQTVGTGPYVIKSISPQNITLVRNPLFWGPKPAVATIESPGYYTNATADAALQTSQAQWGGPFLTSVTAYTAAGNGSHHYWFPPYADVMLVPNMKTYPLNITAFRQAVNYALNRPQFAQNADLGEEGAVTNATGFVLPRDSSDVPPQYKNLNYSVNLGKAKSILTAAGFTYHGTSLYAPNGTPVKLSVTVPSDFSDWVAGTPTVVQNLKALGIQASINAPAYAEFTSDLSTGNFDLILWAQFSTGPGPFYQFDQFLNSSFSAPIGQSAASNYGRWDDPATDAALAQYATSNSPSVQQQAMYKIAQIMVNDVPLFPLEYQVAWGEEESSQFTGWPSASDPYATVCPYLAPSNELVILRLKPAK
jgi:peptide/nickel transport system substrate-binding protein